MTKEPLRVMRGKTTARVLIHRVFKLLVVAARQRPGAHLLLPERELLHGQLRLARLFAPGLLPLRAGVRQRRRQRLLRATRTGLRCSDGCPLLRGGPAPTQPNETRLQIVRRSLSRKQRAARGCPPSERLHLSPAGGNVHHQGNRCSDVDVS